MKQFLTFFLALAISFSTSIAQEGLYFGGSIGSSFVNQTLGGTIDEAHIDDVQIDENNFAWKAYLGYKLSENFAFEGGYRNTGKAEDKAENNTISTKTKGWDVAAGGKVEMARLFVFAKAGAFFYNTENQEFEFSWLDVGESRCVWNQIQFEII